MFLTAFVFLSSSTQVNAANDKGFKNCDQFVQSWLKNYEYASKYYSYECSTNPSKNSEDATLIIHGKPGTQNDDYWYYYPKKNEVLRQKPDGSKEILSASNFKSESSTSGAADDSVACDPAGFKGTVAIAEANGYKWPGTFKTAKCSLTNVAAFVWSGPASASAMLAVTQDNPIRIQYYKGGSIALFCVKLIDGSFQNVGKTCD